MAKSRIAEISKALVKRRWSESDAQAVVSAWRRSGRRISEYAVENGLSAKRVYRWSARLEGRRMRKVRFHPVRLVGGESAPIEVELLNGRRVRVREGFSSEELRRVLEVVEGGE